MAKMQPLVTIPVRMGFRKALEERGSNYAELEGRKGVVGMVVAACGRARRAFVAGLLVLIVASLGSLAGCRRQPPAAGPGTSEQGELPGGGAGAGSGSGGGGSGGAGPESSEVVPSSLEPLALAVLTGEGGNLAIGPLANNSISYGWLPGEPDRVWGWGHLEGYREQFYFTLGTDGTLQAMRIPESLTLAGPVPAPGACLGVHRGESACKAWRLPFEGSPTELCPAVGDKESPSGDFALWFEPAGGTVLYDKRSGTMTAVDAIPSWGFPYSGCATDWVSDTLAVVRYEDEAAQGSGLEFTRLPDGVVIGRQVRPGYSLSPLPSPDGEWLAVLTIDRATAILPDEAIFELDAGQELTVYARDALGAGASGGIALAIPSGRLAMSLVWAPDGSKLAFAVVSSVECAGMDVIYQGPASVCLATPPAFETKTLTLEECGDPWLPRSLSPEGRYLALWMPRDAEGERSSLVWDLETDQEVALSPSEPGAALDLLEFIWVGPSLFLSREAVGEKDFRVLVDVSTGKAFRLPWPAPAAYSWCGVASAGGYIAIDALVPPGDSLGPFGQVAPGLYLVLSPTQGQ